MSTLAEIEAAIATLPDADIEELTARLMRRLDGAPRKSARETIAEHARGCRVEDFFGAFSSGDPNGSDNERIDADLAREAGRGL